jgi:hypothetical protein
LYGVFPVNEIDCVPSRGFGPGFIALYGVFPVNEIDCVPSRGFGPGFIASNLPAFRTGCLVM